MKPQCKRFAAVLLSLLSFQASATTRYVNVNSASPMSPYTSWATAAATIQDAANVAVTGDLILVTNGVYQTGGSAAIGRVFIQPPIKVQSVNGPAVTIINGAGVMRCAELSSGVTLSGFTLANGAALTHSGGGVYCLATSATMINCIFTNNSATVGGGALSGTFSNCTFVGNIATNYGGGVYGGTINQCSFISNSAGYYGGGAFQKLAEQLRGCWQSVRKRGRRSEHQHVDQLHRGQQLGGRLQRRSRQWLNAEELHRLL